jgi:hypothetical protein
LCSSLQAQKFLALTKTGINTRLRFYEGDKVGFKLKGENHIYKGTISYCGTTSVMLSDSINIQLPDVAVFYDYEHRRAAKFGSSLLITAGVFYSAIVLINGALADSGELKNKNNAIAVGCMIGGGLILLPFANRHYKLNSNRRLSIIDVTIKP